MKMKPMYTMNDRPILITEKIWYELIRGPYELEDGSYLYLAKATGRVFPDSEFVKRCYYIRIAKARKETIHLNEERMGDKLYFRRIMVKRIADRIHNIEIIPDVQFGFKKNQSWALGKYDFTVAKIHNHKDWMDKPTIQSLPNLNVEKIALKDMGLSVHGFKYLKRAQIDNMQKLVSLTEDERIKICHGNERVLEELEKVVESFGLYFVKVPA